MSQVTHDGVTYGPGQSSPLPGAGTPVNTGEKYVGMFRAGDN